MKFNPEDEQLGGPRCRNCHKGSSGCGGCHNTDVSELDGVTTDTAGSAGAEAASNSRTAITFLFSAMYQMAGYPAPSLESVAPLTAYKMTTTSEGIDQLNSLEVTFTPAGDIWGKAVNGKTPIIKNSRTVSWSTAWRSDANPNLSGGCSDDGLSWPHRTLGWKMLKDDLFGIDVTGTYNGGKSAVIGVGETRKFSGTVTHDLDSVCLDCHNPTIWNAGQVQTKEGHVDTPDTTADDKADDLLQRGLP